MLSRRLFFLYVFGIAALVVLCVLLLLPHVTVSEVRTAAEEKGWKSPGRTTTGARKDFREDRSAATRLGRNFHAHAPEDLEKFIIPLLQGRDLTLQEAMRQLMSHYKEACYMSRTVALPVEFQFADEPGHRISFSLSRAGFGPAAEHLAALAGLATRRGGLRFEFFKKHTDPDSGLLYQTFRVPRDTSSRLRNALARLEVDHEDSFSGMLKASGMLRGEGNSVTLSNSDILLATVHPWELEVFNSWVSVHSKPLLSIKAAIKFIRSPSPLVMKNFNIESDVLHNLDVLLESNEGAELISIPDARLSEGDQRTVESSSGGKIEWRGYGVEVTRWSGYRVEIQAERVGLKLISSDTVTARLKESPDSEYRRINRNVAGENQTLVSYIGEREGIHLYRLLALSMESLTSGDDSYPYAETVPESPGFVISPYNGKLVDVRDFPSDTLVQDPTFPAKDPKYFRVP